VDLDEPVGSAFKGPRRSKQRLMLEALDVDEHHVRYLVMVGEIVDRPGRHGDASPSPGAIIDRPIVSEPEPAARAGDRRVHAVEVPPGVTAEASIIAITP
jgi:hypothetical protein